ncbi:MAG TPA: sulfatase [Nocardioides sp.]|nr:sulfatase [Nocardioides sp.]
MARRPAPWVAAVAVAALAVSAGGSVRPAADPAAPEPAAAAAEAPSGGTTYERRHLAARADSVDLAPVVDGRDRPNVLVLMTDDMRDDDLKFMPNTQRLLGDRGVRFVNAFSPHPLCCPARASFLSGRYTHNHGVYSNVAPYAFQAFDDRRAFPVWLHRAGYRTSFVGKYLNGYGHQPTHAGAPSHRYVPPGWTDWRGAVKTWSAEVADPHLFGSPYHYYDTTLNHDGRLEPHRGRYQTFLYSDLAQEQVRSAARAPAPFLGVVSFTAPHDGRPVEADDVPAGASPGDTSDTAASPARPGYAKGRFAGRVVRIPGGNDPADRIVDKPGFLSHLSPLTARDEAMVLTRYVQRAESLAVVDDEVGNIVASLERSGELDNTYVLFTSDNGFFAGEHRRRGGKRLAYEPSLRVPVLVRGPGLPAGEVRTDPFLTTDLAPTIREMAGLPPDPALDGVSMLDVARDGDRGWTRSVLFEGGPRPVPDGTRATLPLTWEGRRLDVRYSLGVRTRRYLYVEHTADPPELYDLLRDPRQRVNLAAGTGASDSPRRPGVRRLVGLLAAELDRLRDCSGAACSAPAPAALRRGPVAPAWWPRTLVGEDGRLDSGSTVSHIR